jgi:hypothetical protein
MMNPEPQREHRWLEGLVGEWTYESEPCAVPGQEPAKFTGSESVSSLGGPWVVGHGKGDMPGGATARTMITLGLDSQRKRFVGAVQFTQQLWTSPNPPPVQRDFLTALYQALAD